MSAQDALFLLEQSKQTIDRLVERVTQGRVDTQDRLTFATEVGGVIEYLCAAWHVARMSDAEFDQLDGARLLAINRTVPRWNTDVTLVEVP